MNKTGCGPLIRIISIFFHVNNGQLIISFLYTVPLSLPYTEGITKKSLQLQQENQESSQSVHSLQKKKKKVPVCSLVREGVTKKAPSFSFGVTEEGRKKVLSLSPRYYRRSNKEASCLSPSYRKSNNEASSLSSNYRRSNKEASNLSPSYRRNN
jgi:hypothetical protein